jgi:hypothetical protein
LLFTLGVVSFLDLVAKDFVNDFVDELAEDAKVPGAWDFVLLNGAFV